MPQTNLFGSYELTNKKIEEVVLGIGAGAYALGHLNEKGNLVVSRIGRSDDDLNRRLKDYVGKYKVFKYAFYTTIKDAFIKECELYHNFSPKDNDIHPATPKGTNYKCPYCP